MNFRLQQVVSCAALGAALVASLPAQGVVGPTRLGPSFQPAGLNPPGVPANSVRQVQLLRLPGDPAGTWTAAMTVTGLAAAHGGQGGSDLLIGRYDAAMDTFTPTLLAAACNSTGTEFGAMLDAEGLNLVFERDGWVHRASRPSLQQPFGPSQVVEGLPYSPFYDPALGTVGGQKMLFYVQDGTIRRALFDEATGRVVGPSLVVVGPSRPGAVPNSPTPIVDGAGETTGLLHHELLGTDNDQYLTPDLERATPSHLVLDTAAWLNNGGAAGGLIVSAESAPQYHTLATPAAWMSGAEATIGRSMRVSLLVPPAAAGSAVSFLILGLLHSAAPLPIPGIQGALGIDPGLLITWFAIGPHDRSGEAGYSVAVPNDPSLIGAVLPVQGASQVNGALAFTNTSSLRVAAHLPAHTLSLPYDGSQQTLVAPVDPNDAALTVMLPASAPLPIEILALDGANQPMGEPTSILPGSMASLCEPGAWAYVARMPYQPPLLATVQLQGGLAVCATYKKSPYCRTPSGDWYEQKLDNVDGILCVEVQPRVDGVDTDCNPVTWEILSKVGGAWLTDVNGSANSGTDIADQAAATPRAGATERKIRYRCNGDTRTRCRVTIAVTVVKAAADCPTGKVLRR